MDEGARELTVSCQAMEQRILRLAEGQGLTPLDSGSVQDVALRNEVKKVVVFADAHHKNTMEFPSSTAVAVEDGIIPHLTSNSVNCGMALVRTNLMAGDLREKELDTFYALVRASFPGGSSDPTITIPEVFEAITSGAQWALQRYELDEEQFAHVAQSTRPAYIPINECEVESLHKMSHDVLEESCHNFGAIGKSNHFIEVQMVEDIVDRRVADLFNVKAGQLLIMYHGGGGAYCGIIGNLFVPRKKGSWRGKYYNLTRRKIPFHLFTARSGKELRKRLSYYFFNRGFPHLPTSEEENRRLLTYDHFAMNYGYAYRIASLAMIQRALKQISGSIELSLLYDLPHNLITREVINGEEVYVHRHNASPCYPAHVLSDHAIFGTTGQPVLLPGTNRTGSYLCVADHGAEHSLFSADHGAGHTVKRFIQSGKSKQVNGVTRRYSYDTSEVELVNHYDDAGVRAVLDVLRASKIVRPVAKLRPIGCLT